MSDQYQEYLICKERGHKDSGHRLASDPPWNVCSKCGAWYRTECKLIEANIPGPPENDNG